MQPSGTLWPRSRLPRNPPLPAAASMLSVVASLTPYSDFNQSPRNMYQCQMAKQTMGTPGQALQHRVDTKMYRLQTPQVGAPCRARPCHRGTYSVNTSAFVWLIVYGYCMPPADACNRLALPTPATEAYTCTRVCPTSICDGCRNLSFNVESCPANREAITLRHPPRGFVLCRRPPSAVQCGTRSTRWTSSPTAPTPLWPCWRTPVRQPPRLSCPPYHLTHGTHTVCCRMQCSQHVSRQVREVGRQHVPQCDKRAFTTMLTRRSCP